MVPTLDELQRFTNKVRSTDKEKDEKEEDEELQVLARAQPRRAVTFHKGDMVKVTEGDLKHLKGIVESVSEDTVTMRPQHEELHDLLVFQATQLQKYFKQGNHVKVIGGRYEGEVGLVLSVEDNVAVLFSDLTQKELKVLLSDLQQASEVTTGRLELGSYELHDLVSLDSHAVGMIVRIERDAFKILDNNGNLRTVKLQEMGQKRMVRNPQAFDSMNNPIGLNDQVQVLEGRYKGKQGTIKHLYRYYAFLHSRELPDNSGIFVERTTNLSVRPLLFTYACTSHLAAM